MGPEIIAPRVFDEAAIALVKEVFDSVPAGDPRPALPPGVELSLIGNLQEKVSSVRQQWAEFEVGDPPFFATWRIDGIEADPREVRRRFVAAGLLPAPPA